ncbi:MAG: alpha/beta fold hydrolase, partial [Oscillospiraceae bacterium]
MELIKTNFEFKSSNGINTIRGFKICKAEGPYKACVQISHGMVEHIGRYESFMRYMAQLGFVMYAHDHLGHKNSTEDDSQLGYFAPQDGYKCVLSDLATTAKMAKSENPDLKLFLLGHSMGSFYARAFAAWYSQLIDGVIISGTGGSNKMAAPGKMIVNTLIKIKGEKYHSDFVANLSFKGFLSKIENPKTSSDWISRDEEVVNTYVNDKYCQFQFTLSGFRDLMDINTLSNSEECYKAMDLHMPIYIFSGSMDPVGGFGMGVMEVFEKYKTKGCTDV